MFAEPLAKHVLSYSEKNLLQEFAFVQSGLGWTAMVRISLIFSCLYEIDVSTKKEPLIMSAIKCRGSLILDFFYFSQTLGYFGNMKTSVCLHQKDDNVAPQLVLCADYMFYMFFFLFSTFVFYFPPSWFSAPTTCSTGGRT